MRNYLKYIGSFVLYFALTVGISTQAAAWEPFGKGDDKTKEPMSGDLASVKGSNQLAVPFFRIKFLKQSLGTARADGFLLKRSASASARVNLAGISEQTFQAITDKTYTDLMAKLSAKGYKTVGSAAITAAPSYQAISNDYPDIDDTASLYVPMNFKYPGGITIGIAYGKVLGDLKTPILSVDYIINFVSFDKDTYTDVGGGGQSAEAKITAVPVVHVSGQAAAVGYNAGPKCEKMSVACAGDNSNAQIRISPYSQIAIGKVSDVTSGGMKAAQVVTGLLSGLSGGSSSERTNIQVDADEEAFTRAALEALSKANDGIVNLL